jgi:hypothetical protein
MLGNASDGSEMRIIAVIGCLSMLPWVAGAAAEVPDEKEYALTVSVHADAPKLTADDVKRILKGAGDILKENGCDVTFKLKGPIQSFASPSAVIKTEEQRDAVHAVKADVKVVNDIKYCRPGLGDRFNGCAYPATPGSKSIIVTHARAHTLSLRSILWAHEFGHRTGLHHRPDEDALMSGCGGLWGEMRDVSESECRCFLLGPSGCPSAPPDKKCDVGGRGAQSQ